MKYYFKFLDQNRQAYHANMQWPLPGEWTKPIFDLIPCQSGYHICRKQDLLYWSYIPELWIAEAKGVMHFDDKAVAISSRLIRRVEEWNRKNQRLFAADCAERVLEIFEFYCPNDLRPRQAIEISRRFALGQATQSELNAAATAVEEAAQSLTKAKISASAWAAWAAWSVAFLSCPATANSACLSSSNSTHESIRPTWEAERTWQINHLLTHYLNLNPEDFV